MTASNPTDLIREAAIALKAGDRRTARILLTQALDHDPENQAALLWLSGAVDSIAQQRACLERVLAINPHNQAAIDGLAWLDTSDTHDLAVETGVEELGETEWSPPTPIEPSKLASMPVTCYACGGQIYGKAAFCWRCHAAVHVCANCEFAPESRCKALQNIQDLLALNTCKWWRPG